MARLAKRKSLKVLVAFDQHVDYSVRLCVRIVTINV